MNPSRLSFSSLRTNNRAAALVEYVVLLAILGVGLLGVVFSLGRDISDVFADVDTTLSDITAPVFAEIPTSPGTTNTPTPTTCTPGTWVQQDSQVTAGLRDIVWNGTTFVVVGGNGTITTSPNGLDWTVQSAGTGFDIQAVDHTPLGFMLGAGVNFYTSPDGATWTFSPTGFDGWRSILSLTYAPNFDRYYSGSPLQTEQSSLDGSTWTTLTVPNSLGSVVGRFVFNDLPGPDAVGIALSNARIFPTTNGTSFPGANATTLSAFVYNGIWANNQFVVVGDAGSVFSSPDGFSWTTNTTSLPVDLRGVALGDRYVVTGFNGQIFSSPDLFTWTQEPTPTTARLLDVVYADSLQRFVAIGDGGVILTSSCS